MTSSLCQACTKEAYSYIARVSGLITVEFSISGQFLLMICHITPKIGKKSYRPSNNDVINWQTSLKIHMQFYSTSSMAFRSKTWYSGSFILMMTIVCTLRENQPLRLLLNSLFYHFKRSQPNYKSQRIKLLDVLAACNRLNVNALINT